MQPLEIYVHIPFCVRKCLYCDFLSFPVGEVCRCTSDGVQCDAYMEALLKEIRYTSRMVNIKQNYEVCSIFIGGGTPSLINEVYITKTLCELRSFYAIAEDAEITIETNPGTLTAEKLRAYRQAGINRLSIGLQSANDAELERLGRIHTYADFLHSYQLAREAGFTNISIDLMTALPGQTMQDLQATLREVIALKPEHISAYSLIIEEGTPYAQLYSEDDLPPEEEDRDMYEMTRQMLAEAGYHRYEISNYARSGYESRHNTGYWKRTPYLGMGLGASSLFEECRWKNEENPEAYINELSLGTPPKRYEEQQLTTRMQMEEFLFLGLRMTEGIRAAAFEALFGRTLEEVYGEQIRMLTEEGLLKGFTDDFSAGIRLTLRGLDLSNYVFAQFI